MSGDDDKLLSVFDTLGAEGHEQRVVNFAKLSIMDLFRSSLA